MALRSTMLKTQYSSDLIEAGCDEAGRGCLAGPVVAAAVILDKNSPIVGLNDSKKLSRKIREKLNVEIRAKAKFWAVEMVWPQEIDRINILNASFLAMHKAVDKLGHIPQLLLIDGNRFNSYKNIEHKCIIKGDGKYQSIAAASIIAKTERDDFMCKLHQIFPEYGWDKNMGYPTIHHRNAIRENGITEHHRRSFRLLPEQMEFDFVK